MDERTCHFSTGGGCKILKIDKCKGWCSFAKTTKQFENDVAAAAKRLNDRRLKPVEKIKNGVKHMHVRKKEWYE